MSKYASYFGDPLEVYWWIKLTKCNRSQVVPNLDWLKPCSKMASLKKLLGIAKTVPDTEGKPKYNNLITAYYIAIHKYDQAEQYSRKSLQLDPDSNDLKLNLLNICFVRVTMKMWTRSMG